MYRPLQIAALAGRMLTQPGQRESPTHTGLLPALAVPQMTLKAVTSKRGFDRRLPISMPRPGIGDGAEGKDELAVIVMIGAALYKTIGSVLVRMK